jgi:hypothetical protein
MSQGASAVIMYLFRNEGTDNLALTIASSSTYRVLVVLRVAGGV